MPLDGARALLNPGSVGQPRDGLRDAAYAILELRERPEADTISFHWCGTTSTAPSGSWEAGLLPRLAERLSYGR